MTREESILRLKNEKAVLEQILDDLKNQIDATKSHVHEIGWIIHLMEQEDALNRGQIIEGDDINGNG